MRLDLNQSKSGSDKRKRGRPPNSDGASTRGRILDAALDLFAHKGYEATTVREIAAAVGLRDSALYGHFEGKRQLYDALLERAGSGLPLALGLTPAALVEESPEVALPGFVQQLTAAWDVWDNRRFASVLVREHLKGVDTALAAVRAQLTEVFAQWIREGSIRDDFPASVLAWEFTGPLIPVRLLYFNADSTPEEREAGRRVAEEHAAYFVTTLVTS